MVFKEVMFRRSLLFSDHLFRHPHAFQVMLWHLRAFQEVLYPALF
jgi:hypothetical protein